MALTAKVDADIGAFEQNLGRGARSFSLFEGRLNEIGDRATKTMKKHAELFQQSAERINRFTRTSLGGLTDGTSKAANVLNFAGGAAQQFAGLQGIGSIALMLATGGPVLAGIAALSALVYASGKEARDAAEHYKAYAAALGGLTRNELQANADELERTLNNLKALKREADRKSDTKIAASGAGQPGYLGSMTPVNAKEGATVDRYDTLIADTQRRIQETNDQLEQLHRQEERRKAITKQAKEDFLKSDEGVAQQFAERIGRLTQSLQQMAQGAAPVNGIAAETASMLELLDAKLKSIGNSTSENAVKTRAWLQSLGDAANQVARTQNAAAARTAGVGVNAAGARAGIATPAPFTANEMGFGLDPHKFIQNFDTPDVQSLEEKVGDVEEAIRSGFGELPSALSTALAVTLGARLGGGGAGAQFGASLGGSFAGGIASKLAEKASSKIGGLLGAGVGSVIPFFGTAVGGLLGGAIGGLFGRQKKASDLAAESMERLARLTQQVNEAITNLPAGIKIALARFEATIPKPENPKPPTEPRSPDGGSGGGGQSGGGGAGTGKIATPKDGTSRNILITIGSISLPNVREGGDFVRELGVGVEQDLSRGGTTPLLSGLSLAMARG